MKTITQAELNARIETARYLTKSLSISARMRRSGNPLVLIGYDLRGSDLSNSELRGSDLSNSNLSNSELRGSNLSNSNLSNSNLRGSNLRGSDLSNSDLSNSDLSNSDLRNSNLSNSNLSNSNLSNSNLSGSNLRGCNLSGSELSHSKGFYLLPMQDPRGYAFPHAVECKDGWRIRSGCRDFTIVEAKEHWGPNYVGSRSIGDDYLYAMEWLERKIK